MERKFRETRLYSVAPVSNNLVLAYLGQHVSACRARTDIILISSPDGRIPSRAAKQLYKRLRKRAGSSGPFN